MTELPIQQILLEVVTVITHRRKDLADVEEILGVCTDLDVFYLCEWAKRLDLTEQLAEFLPN